MRWFLTSSFFDTFVVGAVSIRALGDDLSFADAYFGIAFLTFERSGSPGAFSGVCSHWFLLLQLMRGREERLILPAPEIILSSPPPTHAKGRRGWCTGNHS